MRSFSSRPAWHPDGRPLPLRSLRVAPGSASRLLRCGQGDRCRECGNRIEWYHLGTDTQQPVRLHPRELPAAGVPEGCRWHVSSGAAYPAGDGSNWCRVRHAVVCPARESLSTPPGLAALRRALAVNTRRRIDTGAFTPPPAPVDGATPAAAGPRACRPARPIVQLLYVRYLAARPVDEIQCVAQTRRRHRCTSPLFSPGAPAGTWRLVPATATTGQLALPAEVMAVYDLSTIPYAEQLRWRAQRCQQHEAVSAAPDLAVTEWEPFDPLRHHAYLHNRLPADVRRPRPAGPPPP
ncbi:DUF6083 domain-containing protein [Streptomyces sp. NPDC051913]|uniref:DUF6083 domain-containing protein n=1 Tax=Streptomyces sp. NPDC051913 TaxID=3365676 RepID=UPI0037D5AA68